MSKTIVVVGFGPGAGSAVAERFGAEGFAVALIGRSGERLAAGVAALEAQGVRAAAFAADAGDAAAIGAAIAKVRAELGSVTVLHWNAFGGVGDTRNLLTAEPAAVHSLFDVPVVGLLAAVREALPDLKAAGDGAVLITNGGFGQLSTTMDAVSVRFGVMGAALANGAKHKLVGLLAEQLKAEGVHVGEVMVVGEIKPASAPKDHAGVESHTVAAAFWDLYRDRTDVRALLSQ